LRKISSGILHSVDLSIILEVSEYEFCDERIPCNVGVAIHFEEKPLAGCSSLTERKCEVQICHA
jgi:hypothetical protein